MKLSIKSERIDRLKSLCLLVVAWFLTIQAVHKRLIFIQRIRTIIINKKKHILIILVLTHCSCGVVALNNAAE